MNSQESVALAHRLGEWLRRANIPDDAVSEVAVGLADVIYAARQASEALNLLLEEDPRSPTGASNALRHLGRIHAWLLTEAKWHLEDLEREWPRVERTLEAVSEKREGP